MEEFLNKFLYHNYKTEYNFNDVNNIFSCLDNDDFYKTALYSLEINKHLEREGIQCQTDILKNEIVKKEKKINELKDIINIYKNKYNINVYDLDNLNDYLSFKELLRSIKKFFNITFPFIADEKILIIFENTDEYDLDLDDEYNEEDYENDIYNDEDYLKMCLKMKKIEKIKFDIYLNDVYKLLDLFDTINYDEFEFLINSSSKSKLFKLFNKYKREFNQINICNPNYCDETYFKDLLKDFKRNLKEYKDININEINIDSININKVKTKYKNNIDKIINIFDFDNNKINRNIDYYNSFKNLFEFLTKYIKKDDLLFINYIFL